MDALDADVLIYAASFTHPFSRELRRLFEDPPRSTVVGVGSILLLPEVLSKPLREASTSELRTLSVLLSRLDLHPVDQLIAESAVGLGAKYRLRAADAIHLATAILAGADRFITNNRKDFAKSIEEIVVIYPDDLTD